MWLAGDGLQKIGILGTEGGSAMITIRGGSFWGDLNAAVLWQGSGMVRVSDSTVHVVDEATVLGKQAFMLFYERDADAARGREGPAAGQTW